MDECASVQMSGCANEILLGNDQKVEEPALPTRPAGRAGATMFNGSTKAKYKIFNKDELNYGRIKTTDQLYRRRY